MGKLLNIHAGMAHSPAVIGAYAGIGTAIAAHGTFDARTREAIALAVGNQNGCDYCQAAHTLSARRAGLDDGQILQIRAGELSEAFAHIAANLFTNYFNHYAGTELDLPPAPELQA